MATTRPRIADPDAFSVLAGLLIGASRKHGLDLRRWASMNEALAVFHLAVVLGDSRLLDVVQRTLLGERQ